MSGCEVSVVIPTFNRREILRDMLQALGQQTLAPEAFEVVVVVDGSTDGTLEMLQELKTPYTLRPFYQENAGVKSSVFSSGVSVARNHGAREARGEVLVFLDDDLLPVPELLEEHARVHRQDPNAVNLGRLLPSNEASKKRGWNLWEEDVLERHYDLMARGTRPPAGWRLYSANFSVRREQFLAAGAFDLAMGHMRGEDVELGLRMQARGMKFYFRPGAGAVHRGYRTFKSWCNSANILGPRDLALVQDKGHDQVLERLQGWSLLPAPVRWAISASLGRPWARDGLVSGLRNWAGALSFLRLRGVAHKGYSIIFRLWYWHGVAEAMGGKASFHRWVKQGYPVNLQPMLDKKA